MSVEQKPQPESLQGDGRDGSGAEVAVAPPLPALRTRPEAPSRPPARRRLAVWVGGGGVLLVLAVAVALALWTPRAVLVVVETVAPGPLTRVLAVNGRVAARVAVDVRSTVGGTLDAVIAAEGAHVAQGDILARVDAVGQTAVLRQAEAALDAGLVALAQSKANVRRDRALGPNLPRTALEDAELALQTARQEVDRLTALVDQAKDQLSKHQILAPISGVVVARGVEPGQIVDPAMVLFTMADLTDLIVEADVDEAYATQIRTGQRAVLQFVGNVQSLTGRVDFVALRVDPATGGLEVRVAFDQPQQVPLGLTTTANIVVEERTDALSIPRSALNSDSAGVGVFLVNDGIADRRAVEVVDWPADRLIVTKGLQGAEVIVVDATGIVDGKAVRITSDLPAAEPSRAKSPMVAD